MSSECRQWFVTFYRSELPRNPTSLLIRPLAFIKGLLKIVKSQGKSATKPPWQQIVTSHYITQTAAFRSRKPEIVWLLQITLASQLNDIDTTNMFRRDRSLVWIEKWSYRQFSWMWIYFSRICAVSCHFAGTQWRTKDFEWGSKGVGYMERGIPPLPRNFFYCLRKIAR